MNLQVSIVYCGLDFDSSEGSAVLALSFSMHRRLLTRRRLSVARKLSLLDAVFTSIQSAWHVILCDSSSYTRYSTSLCQSTLHVIRLDFFKFLFCSIGFFTLCCSHCMLITSENLRALEGSHITVPQRFKFCGTY